ncbi:MAG: hypothetical protein U9R03_03790 [Candidatus Aerophobetes bacterium]|nr:hypothetical protein [Candidatus Aerophobetes bacterium]
MLYSRERLKKEGEGTLSCDSCGKPAPYYKGKKGKGVNPLYEWQGNGFCVKCFEEIVRVNPNVVYPAKTVELEEEINRYQGQIRMLQRRITELKNELSEAKKS